MARTVIKWYGPKLIAVTRSAMAARLDHAGRFLRDQIRDDISEPGYDVTGTGKGRRKVIDVRRSKPFHPPFEQTGDLIRSYDYQNDRASLVARVGSGLPYSRYLELGTRKMLPRPHLRRNLFRHAGDIMQILGATI